MTDPAANILSMYFDEVDQYLLANKLISSDEFIALGEKRQALVSRHAENAAKLLQTGINIEYIRNMRLDVLSGLLNHYKIITICNSSGLSMGFLGDTNSILLVLINPAPFNLIILF